MMPTSPIEALKLRFVKGEITHEQYKEMLSALLPSEASSKDAVTAPPSLAQGTYPVPADMNDPLEVVKLRYARGEISKEQYDKMVATLGVKPQSVQPTNSANSPLNRGSGTEYAPSLYPSDFVYQPNWFLNFMIIGYFLVGGILSLFFNFWGYVFALLICAVAVYTDAQKIGAGTHIDDSNYPWIWGVGVVALWIIFYPYYLYKRRSIFIQNQVPLANMNQFESKYANQVSNEYLTILGREPSSHEMTKAKRRLASGQSVEKIREDMAKYS